MSMPALNTIFNTYLYGQDTMPDEHRMIPSYNSKNRFWCWGAFTFFFLLALSSSNANAETAAAKAKGEDNCLMKFYQTKDKACIETFLKSLSTSGEKQPGGINTSALGFFAKLFQSDAQEKATTLKGSPEADVKILFSAALYVADLKGEAKAYAETQGIPNAFRGMEERGLTTLQEIKPLANPADNDILIGAYAASGDAAYIRRVLENFRDASDDMARDSLRLSLMMGKFGPKLAAPNRKPDIMRAICEKYHCKQDRKDTMRIMTLSSAFWAIKSLAAKDAGIRKEFTDFFEKDARLKQILVEEQTAFGNYLVSVAVYAGVKNNAGINSSLSIYEGLGSGQDAAKALIKK